MEKNFPNKNVKKLYADLICLLRNVSPQNDDEALKIILNNSYRLNNMSFTIIISVISPKFVKTGSSKEDDIWHQLRTLMQDFQCLQINMFI